VDTCLSRSGLLSVGEASGAKTGGRYTDFFVLLFLESHRKNKKPHSFSNAMAKRKGMKIQPAVTELMFTTKTGSNAQDAYYIDTAKNLSKMNRRKYDQSRMYAYQGLSFIWRQDATNLLATIELTLQAAGNTWVTHNAHVKGEALWNQMQALVLEDNPSIQGKWAQYIIRLEDDMVTAAILECRDGAGNLVPDGEWNSADYVMPQHDVDPATGLPLAATQLTASLVGDDGATTRSLVKAYQLSRATVSADQPNVPAGMSDSFFNLLTDSGSQEPELAEVIEGENDNPPYALDDYPGADVSCPGPITIGYSAISASEVDGRLAGFVAPCGLLKVVIKGYDATGAEVDKANLPAIDMLLHVSPGTYRGIAAIPMGQ
jgi:hypothetical protein